MSSKRPCRAPGCPEITDDASGYCATHRGQAWGHDDRRPGARARGYTRRWEKARRVFLAEHPLCEECKASGELVPATVVDHGDPHRGDPEVFWDVARWRALCKPCHDRKTATEDGGFGRGRAAISGPIGLGTVCGASRARAHNWTKGVEEP